MKKGFFFTFSFFKKSLAETIIFKKNSAMVWVLADARLGFSKHFLTAPMHFFTPINGRMASQKETREPVKQGSRGHGAWEATRLFELKYEKLSGKVAQPLDFLIFNSS